MSYAIIRNENYKMGQLPYIYRHNERKNTNYSNRDIIKENGIKNYSIKNVNTSYQKAFNNIKEKYKLKGQIKKVSNVMCELIITSDKEFFQRIGEEETKRYFQKAYEFVASYQNLGEEFIVSAKVHMDESTPHMHIVFIPVVHKKDKNGNDINKIAAGLADKCEIQLSYAIGVAQPTSINVDTFGTGKLSSEKLVEIVRENFDLRPAGIIKMLDLRRPIYKQTAAYGHFGRNDLDLPWEKLDKVEVLKKYL